MYCNRGFRALLIAGALALLPACADPAGAGGEGAPTNTALPAAISNNVAPLARAESPGQMRQRAIDRGYGVTGDGVLLDVQTRDLEPGDRARFEIDGVTIKAFSAKYQRVTAVAHTPAAIRALARIDAVRLIAPAYGSAQ